MQVNRASVVGTGAVVNLVSASVPDGKIWRVHHATGRQDDAAATIGLKLYLAIPSSVPGLESLFQLDNWRRNQAYDAIEAALIAREFYMPPRSFLRLVSNNGLPAASVAVLNVLYSEMPIGEYWGG
jgi:hypothetical protein